MDIFKPIRTPDRTPSSSFAVIYLISVVFTFHTLLTVYNSSTYMKQFIDPDKVGLLYALGSALSILLFLSLSSLLSRFGNTTVTLLFSFISIIALVFLGFGALPLIAFVALQAINPLLYLNIDIYSENTIGSNEGETGSKRGLTLSLMAIASVCAPLTMSYIVGGDDTNLAQVYFMAAGIGAIFMFIVLLKFRRFNDPHYPKVRLRDVWQGFCNNHNLRGVISAHFLLQFFFAWMVIYFPLYLATVLNLSWTQIGLVIAAGLVAYVVCEYPIGILADRYFGEKEMMAVGFVILALASASISLLAGAALIAWMLVMFISRVGASLVEVTTESYFFKQVGSKDAQLISLFRLTRPLANLCGALAGTVALVYLPFSYMFVVLGLLMLPGALLATTIVDSR